jgi:hypothetical protein
MDLSINDTTRPETSPAGKTPCSEAVDWNIILPYSARGSSARG